MTWSPTFLEDGDTATASRINGLFTDAQTWLGAIGQPGLQRGAFNRFHAASILQPFGAGWSVNSDFSDTLPMTYNHVTFGASLIWTGWGADGGTATVPSLGTGDRAIVGHPSVAGGYTGPTALISIPSGGVHVGTENGEHVAFLMCFFNCQILSALPAPPLGIPLDPTCSVVFSLQYQCNGAGTWHGLSRSERWVSLEDHQSVPDGSADGEQINFDVPIAASIPPGALTDAGLDPTTAKVTGVRAMVTTYNFNAGTNFNVKLDFFRLTVVPVYCQDL